MHRPHNSIQFFLPQSMMASHIEPMRVQPLGYGVVFFDVAEELLVNSFVIPPTYL